MKKYLLSEADRNEIARMLSHQKSAPPPNPISQPQKPMYQEGDSYWALPPCETGLPAAEIIDGTLVTVGIECCLYRHSWNTDQMQPLLDQAGLPVRATVFNYYQTSEIRLVQVYKHKDGTWTNERPYDRKTQVEASTTPNPVIEEDPTCTGDCYHEADANGVWIEPPTGGCTNATSTTTTTLSPPTTTVTPSTPGSTRYPPGPETTIAPCVATKCTLVCIDTSTTPAPDVYGVPVPYQRFRYALKDGSVCPEGCTCYGLGDPCFLVEGELVSNCIGTGPTSTTTTTIDPNADVCDQADFIFGTAQPLYYRAAIRRNRIAEWEVCQGCDAGLEPFYPLGGDAYRKHDWPLYADVYETPCVSNPCSGKANPGEVTMRAYHWDQQVELWGWNVRGTHYDRFNKKFLANWFVCSNCSGANRPLVAPPIWIYEDESKNLANGVLFDAETNTYLFTTSCNQGFNCNTCGRAPTRREWPYQGPTTTSGPTTTGGPTTTVNPCETCYARQCGCDTGPEVSCPPGKTFSCDECTCVGTSTTSTTQSPNCGCSRPVFCPQPFECVRTVCSKAGAEVFLGFPSQSTKPPVADLPCFPSNTTTTGVPTSTTSTVPPTTSGPNQCVDAYGTVCNCGGGSTTIPPRGGTCPPGYILLPSGDPCVPDGCLPVGTTVPPPPPPPPGCAGICTFRAVIDSATNTFIWFPVFNSNGGCRSGVSGGDCKCPEPDITPTECNQLVSTFCRSERGTTTSPTTPTPCACCAGTTTTRSPCPYGVCRYGSNGSGGWVLRSDTCATACPCPPAASIGIPSEDCDVLLLACGAQPPTTIPPSTSTSTSAPTTTSTPGACCILLEAGGSTCSGALSAEDCALRALSFDGFGRFFPGQACGEVDCFSEPTTTPSPFGACCAEMGGLPICIDGSNSAECVALGGRFFPSQACLPGLCTTTTASPTTTTSGPPVTSLPPTSTSSPTTTSTPTTTATPTTTTTATPTTTSSPTTTATPTTTSSPTTTATPTTTSSPTTTSTPTTTATPTTTTSTTTTTTASPTTTSTPTTTSSPTTTSTPTTTPNPTLGRCCYGPNNIEFCANNTQSECLALGGAWTSGGDCSGAQPCQPPPPE